MSYVLRAYRDVWPFNVVICLDNISLRYNKYMYNLQVLRINTVDVEKQSLVVLVSQTLSWKDFSLNNTMDLPGKNYLYVVSIHADKIWTPPISPANVFKSEVVYDPEEVKCGLTGYCFQQKWIEYTIPCSLHLQVFPFDRQTCELTLSQPIDQSTR